MSEVATAENLHVSLMSPSATLYDDAAISVTAHNKLGEFDVLYNHQNFFSLLDAGDIVINTGSEEKRFPIADGLMKVSNNTVTVFVGIGTNA